MKAGILFRPLLAASLALASFPGQAQQARQTLHGHVRPVVVSGQAAPAGLLSPAQRLNLSIVLPLRNQAELTSLLTRIYDPSSPDYRQFLSVAQFTAQFAPSDEDYQAVVRFAQAHGLTVTGAPANRAVVPVSGTVAQIETAFNVILKLYRHPTENRLFFSPDREPSLDLSVPVAHVAGLNNFSIPHAMVKRAAATQGPADLAGPGSGPGGSFLGSDMRAAYYGGSALTGAGQRVGLVEFDGYNLSDVKLAFSKAGQSSSVSIDNVLLDGVTGAPASGDDSEEVLDIVQSIGMAPELSQVRVYIGSIDADILNEIASEDMAGQIAISWSWSPDDPSTDDIFFEEFAAQGQTVFAASGDDGEYDPLFDNFYPAEDQFVTAVGGTDLVTGSAGGPWASETAWDRSGGGISPDGIPIPNWQAGIATSSNGASTTLRNVPDVAAQADTVNYSCAMGACAENYGGTSFAAPRWAAFMALVNQQAASAGNSAVGFINPDLYDLGQGSSYATAFHDIVSGNNNVMQDCCGWPSYNAVPGYDLVTGWGSPTGQSLIDALAPPAPAAFELSASAGTLTIDPGNSGAITIAVSGKAGFTGSVSLSVSGLPPGVTASWSKNPAAQNSTLTLTANSSDPRGSWLVYVTGASGAATASTSFALELNAPGFSILPSPSNLEIYPSVSGSTTISVTGDAGFAGSVNFAVTSALPGGVTAAWVSNPTNSASVLTLTASSAADTNSHVIVTVTATSGAMSATTTVALVVSPPVFYLNLAPYPSTIAQGGTATALVTAVSVSDSVGAFRLSAPQLPSGVTAAFNPASISLGQSSVLTLTASASAPLGTHLAGIEASGSSSGTISTFDLSVTPTSAPAFTLGVAQSTPTVIQGASVTDAITVNPQNGFTGSVTLTVASALPSGVTASFTPNPASGTSQLTIIATNAAAAGFYVLWIAGASGSQSAVASVFLTVNPPPGFTLGTSPGSLSLAQGAATTANVTVTPQPGFTGSVSLAVTTALPGGMTTSFAPNPTTGSSMLTLAANYTVPTGSYPLIIAGTSGGRTVTTALPLSVAAAATMPTSTVLSITPGSGKLTAGSAYTLTATVSPAGGTAIPTGNVVFTIGSATEPAALNSSGIATYSGAAPTTPGSLTISAAYEGTTEFSPSTSNSLNETVSAIATTTNLSINPNGNSLVSGSSYTLTATVTPANGVTAPTGNVVFTIGSATESAALNSSGIATYSGAAPTTPGSLNLSASYQGTMEFSPSTSNTLDETVAAAIASDFTVAATPVSVSPGATIGNTSTITITPSGGLTGSVALTVAIASSPSGAQNLPSLSFGSTTPVSMTGDNPATAVLTISTTASTNAQARSSRPRLPWYASGGAALDCILLFGFPSRRRAWRSLAGMAILLFALAGGVLACSATFNNLDDPPPISGTTAGNYTLTVTGVSGTTTASATISLTVQ